MSTIDLNRLATLAQLRLDGEEEAAAARDLDAIVAMIDAMADADIDGVAPMSHPLDLSQRLRSDAVTEAVDRDTYQALAPAADAGYYLVPTVIE